MATEVMPTAEQFKADAATIVPNITGPMLDELVFTCLGIYLEQSRGNMRVKAPAEYFGAVVEVMDLLSSPPEAQAAGQALYDLLPTINWNNVPVINSLLPHACDIHNMCPECTVGVPKELIDYFNQLSYEDYAIAGTWALTSLSVLKPQEMDDISMSEEDVHAFLDALLGPLPMQSAKPQPWYKRVNWNNVSHDVVTALVFFALGLMTASLIIR